MTDEKTEQEQQELIYKFSMYERQIREMQQQIEAIEKGIADLDVLNTGLEELKGSVGKEIYAQLGKGIFINAKINSENLNVDIGNGNFVKKSIPETQKLIGEQTKKLEMIKKELEQSLIEIEEELTGMMSELEN
jgi:prefoldin alpha subunit